jgi:hypothetical protein
MVNHGIGVDALNQVSFVPADIVANNIVAISTTPCTVNKTYHVVRDDYANMLDITELGILKFMHRKGIISVAARELDPASPPSRDMALTDAPSATAV